MKKVVKKLVRSYCPNIPLLKKKLNVEKLKDINKYTMQEDDVFAGEKSSEKQVELVKVYSEKWQGYAKSLNQKLDEYLDRCEEVKSRNDLESLRNQVLFACFAYGFMPDEFFAYELEKKTAEERREYISDRDRYNIVYKMNDIIDVDIFFDKYKTYSKFSKYYRRDAISIEKKSDYDSFVAFVKKHPIFVKKNVALSKGDSVELVNMEICEESTRQIFDEMLSAGKYMVEERVVQSAAMSKLNPSSVNTIRCMTFRIKNGVEVGPCFLKVGRGDSFVDNGGKGGILIGIDRETGVLNTVGYDEFLNTYVNHPDTKLEFIGYQLPEWEQMKELAVKMSMTMPTVGYIGWDLAHTDNGWVVIEGNGGGQFIGPQIVWKRGFKNEIEKLINGK